MTTVLVVPSGAEAPPKAAGEFEGWGTSLAWFAHATGKDPVVRDAVCSQLFDKDKLALNIIRYNIGGTDINAKDMEKFRTGGAVPCCSSKEGGYDASLDEAQTAYLLRAREIIGPDFVSEAFVNSPPYWMLRSGTSRGHERPFRNNLAKTEVPAFADTMIRALKHFAKEHNLVFGTLSPFNEPGSPAWIAPIACQEGCYFNHKRMNDVINALFERKEDLGPTKVVAHEQFCIADGAKDAAKTGKKLWPAVGRFNVHTYNSSEFIDKAPFFITKLQDNGLQRAKFKRAALKAGKDVWVSEYGTGKGAEHLARHIVLDLATLLPTAWVYWQAVEEPGATWGLVQVPLKDPDCECKPGEEAPADDKKASEDKPPAPKLPKGTVLRTPQYHVLKRLVRVIPKGARVFPVKGFKGSAVGAWLGPGKLNYVFVHPAAAKKPLTLSLDTSALSGAGGKPVTAKFTMLDLCALDVAGSASRETGLAEEFVGESVREVSMSDDGAGVVQIPTGYMCCIEFSA